MYVDQVAALFRQYIDEPDRTFVTDADVATYLSQGYAEFRRTVMEVDNNRYVHRVTVPFGAGLTYDLADVANAVVIMGAGPLTDPRLERALQLWTQDAAGNRLWQYMPVGNIEDLEQGQAGYAGLMSLSVSRYMLDGTVLRISANPNQSIILRYVPASTVDWTRQTSGDNEWIDDLEPFHDLIALKAYAQYAIRDAAESPEVMRQVMERDGALRSFLYQGFGGTAPVVPDMTNW